MVATKASSKRKSKLENVSSSSSESDFEDAIHVDTDDDDDDAESIFCGGLFSQDKLGEQWVQSKKRSHCDCAGNSDNVNFICDTCLNG
jgi:hypothetical protein